MKTYITFLLTILSTVLFAQQFTPNYDESKIPEYELPAILTSKDGSTITKKKQWNRSRREEILKDFETHMYGKLPEGEVEVTIKKTREKEVLDGKSVMKEVSMTFTRNKQQASMMMLIFLPKAERKSPVFLGLNFKGNHTVFDDPDISLTESWIGNDDKFETRRNDYYVEVNVAFPGIKNGSVIEYKYEIVSDYITNLKTWYFQEDIPVAYSDYECMIPEYFKYQKLNLGSVTNLTESTDSKTETFEIMWRELNPGGGFDQYNRTLNSNSTSYRAIAKNVPPVMEEPFMVSKVDLPSRLEFQLDYVQFPNRPIEQIAGTYEKFNQSLLKHPNFGGRFQTTFYAKDWSEGLEGKSDDFVAQSIYAKAKNHFIWDGIHAVFSTSAGRNAFNNKKGSSSDINLTLVAAYREAGLEAHPVILSTRSNGIVHPIYPNFNDFNYVIASVKVGDKYYLTDAASNMPFGSEFLCPIVA